jgi:hypothetical protein
MASSRFLLSLLGVVTIAVASTAFGCAANTDDDGSVDAENEALSETAALRFDVATLNGGRAISADPDPTRCPQTVAADSKGHRRCLREQELEALNYQASHSHFVAMPTDSHRTELHAKGNALAGYVDDMNAGFPGKSGEAAAKDALSTMQGAYGGKIPQWIILNEISASAWPKTDAEGAAYRKYVVDFARTIESAGKIPVVCAPFNMPLGNADAWSALAKVGYVAAEIQLTGPKVIADAGYAMSELSSSVSAFDHLGVGKGRLMFVDNYSNSVPGTEWGRDGVSLTDWKKVIVARTKAAAATHFAGYISYAWEGNTGEVTSENRIALEKLYASQDVL